ncbi:MAG: hypothetical protein FJ100_17925 [Deltaproteobacteria bacterium]|nr:hypothetical protein [Deltaproteobacteria bacterium]
MTEPQPSVLALARPQMRWWPRARPGGVEYAPRQLARNWLIEIAVLLAIAVSPIPEWTGMTGIFVVGVGLVHGLCIAVLVAIGSARAHDSRRIHVQVAWALLYNTGLCLALVVRSGDPGTPWWYGYILYAALTGASQNLDGARLLFGFFLLAPLAAVPLLLAQGGAARATWSSVGLAGAMGGLCYYTIAAIGDSWRTLREHQAAELAAAQAASARLEREALARDLHDAVGSQLAIVALYGDLLEEAADDAEARADLVRTLREAARQGLGELRAVLNALAPEATTLGDLEDHLRRLALTARVPGGVIEIRVDGDATVAVAPVVRLVAVRVAQQAIANAVVHGRAQRVTLALSVQGELLQLAARDDGIGFDTAMTPPDRGLAGLQRRAEQSGGELQWSSAVGHGASVLLRLPLRSGHVEARTAG